MTSPAGAPCPNCGTPATGRYCAACGQDNALARIESRPLLLEAFQGLVGWENSVLRTLRGLVADPGGVSADYVAGRRRRFVPPVRLCLLSLAAWLFLTRQLELDALELSGMHLTVGDPSDPRVVAVLDVQRFIGRNLEALLFLALPLRAWMLRWFFPGSGRNVAESFVFALYLASFGYLLGIAVAPLIAFGATWAAGLQQFLALVWLVRGARTFFGASLLSTVVRVPLLVFLHLAIAFPLFALIALGWIECFG